MTRKLTILFLVMLTSCMLGRVVDIEQVRNISFPDDPFKEKLREGYIELSDAEAQKSDMYDANNYGRKANLLLHGINPDMETLYNRDISLTRMNNLLGAKYFLETAFAHNMREILPEPTAEAQLMFDCWVDHAEENKRSYSDIGMSCKDRFEIARDRIEKRMQEMKQQELAAIEREQQLKLRAQQEQFEKKLQQKQSELIKKYRKMPEPSFVFFPYNSIKLDITAKNLLKKVAGDVELFKPRKVAINANTDNTGSYDYNMRLALRRGREVADYLVTLGVDRHILDIKAYGENNPRKQYLDPRKDVRNRYVEITFLKDNRVYY